MTYRRLALMAKHNHAKFKPRRGTRYWCNQCERWRTREQFGKRPGVPCGLSPECKECLSKREKTRRECRKANVHIPVLARRVSEKEVWGK